MTLTKKIRREKVNKLEFEIKCLERVYLSVI